MTTHVFNFPDVGEGIHEGQLVEWLITEGTFVKEDTPVCKVETDKAVVEIPAPVTGTITILHAVAGEEIYVGNPLITFEVGDSPSTESPKVAPVATSTERPVHLTVVETPRAVATIATLPVSNKRVQDVPATPRTRALARKLGVDITTILGTGRAGRVTEEDVEAALRSPQAPTSFHSQVGQVALQNQEIPAEKVVPKAPAKPSKVSANTTEGSVEIVPMSFLRKKIGEQMRLSTQRLVHVTHVEEADITDLYAVYKESKQVLAEQDIKLSPLPYFIKAVVACLKKYPLMNSNYDMEAGEIHCKKFYNIGLAVDTEQGLVVPVITNADKKSIAEIANEINDKAQRARTRELGLDEMKGGTFTLSNIGSIGGVLATPIINYPEVAIIALHALEDKPSVHQGEICIRKKMYLSLSFDHQLIDGGDAARFMRDLRKLLENPTFLFTQI